MKSVHPGPGSSSCWTLLPPSGLIGISSSQIDQPGGSGLSPGLRQTREPSLRSLSALGHPDSAAQPVGVAAQIPGLTQLDKHPNAMASR